jgi:hypothetical protein
VRENQSLNKMGVLKHVKEIIFKIRKISDKLSKVMDWKHVKEITFEIRKILVSDKLWRSYSR